MPEISVVIPVYNGEKYILRCLEMFSAQTEVNFELIFVDDGSKDNSRELLDQAKALFEHCIILHKENGGVSSARNYGLSVVGGQFVVFADIDDLWDPEYLEKLLNCYKTSNVDLTICGYRNVDMNGLECFRFQPKEAILDKNRLMKNALKYRNINIALWNKMFRMDIIKENSIRFNEDLSIGEDMVFLLEYCTYLQKAKVIPDCLYSYTQNPNGAMLNRKSAVTFDKKWISEWYAIQFAESILREDVAECENMLRRKKVRVADKLLSLMVHFGYQDKMLRKQLVSCLRNNIFVCLAADDIDLSRKLGICLNSVSPYLCHAIKNLK
ncbi:MAG: glycosyltransferase [Eubacteriales bacterium]|nr:glycosyltransferase [Eubacteriales bacterium]